MPIRSLLRAFFLTKATLLAENAILRQQLIVLKRSVPRASVGARDRLLWVVLSRLWPRWRSLLVIVQPETVLRWHRLGWRLLWRRKSGGGGRPPIAAEIRALITRLSKENRTWRAPRIQKELALLGHRVSVNTVRRYMERGGRPGAGQSWATFLKNHAHEIAACVIGDRLRARDLLAQATEALLGCNILNRMSELGGPSSVAIPR